METARSKRHHLFIGGPGRSGTSFLVKLLHHCGMQTGLADRFHDTDWHEAAEAGLEDRFSADRTQPYVLKSPWLFKDLGRIIADRNVVIDQVVIPIRRLETAAASRVIVEKQHLERYKTVEYDDHDVCYVAGGCNHSLTAIDQERSLAVNLYRLVEELVGASIPMTFCSFPRLSLDANYAFDFVRKAFPISIGKDAFVRIHESLGKEGAARVEDEVCAVEDQPSVSSADTTVIALRREIARLEAGGSTSHGIRKGAEAFRPDPTDEARTSTEIARGPIANELRLLREERGRARWLLVTGAPRSGTSLLRTILVQHPQIGLLREYGLTSLVERIDGIVARRAPDMEDWDRQPVTENVAFREASDFYRNRPFRAASRRGGGDPRPENLHDVAAGLFCGMFPEKSEISVFGDKMPISGPAWEDIPVLFERLPDLRIVAIVRAPDQVIRSSLVRREATRHGMDTWPIRTVQEAMRQWLTAWRIVVGLRERYDQRVFVVKYEDLCADLPAQTQRITAWLGLLPHQVTMEISSLDRAVIVHSTDEQEEIERLTGPLVEAWSGRPVETLLSDFAGYASPYLLGDVIQLSEEDASAYLVKGFSFREDWGRWTDGEHAVVSIPHGVKRGSLFVELRVAQAHRGEGDSCDVVVRCGWGEPKLFALGTDTSRIAFVTRAEEAETLGTCLIDLAIVNPKHPDAPPSDSRALGILLKSIRLSKLPQQI